MYQSKNLVFLVYIYISPCFAPYGSSMGEKPVGEKPLWSEEIVP